MKTLLFTLFLAAICSGVSAEDTNSKKIISTYYGTKASTNANNPCKGATTRKCGTIESEITMEGSDSSSVIRTVKDAEGNVLSTQTLRLSLPVRAVTAKIIASTIEENAAIED